MHKVFPKWVIYSPTIISKQKRTDYSQLQATRISNDELFWTYQVLLPWQRSVISDSELYHICADKCIFKMFSTHWNVCLVFLSSQPDFWNSSLIYSEPEPFFISILFFFNPCFYDASLVLRHIGKLKDKMTSNVISLAFSITLLHGSFTLKNFCRLLTEMSW